jgi:DNA-directed RNA polymerase specialized sigma24 family protein
MSDQKVRSIPTDPVSALGTTRLLSVRTGRTRELMFGKRIAFKADRWAAETNYFAFLVALQMLPPRQRAALLLHDVSGFSASEAADIVGSSEADFNDMLQRARSTVDFWLRPRGQ